MANTDGMGSDMHATQITRLGCGFPSNVKHSSTVSMREMPAHGAASGGSSRARWDWARDIQAFHEPGKSHLDIGGVYRGHGCSRQRVQPMLSTHMIDQRSSRQLLAHSEHVVRHRFLAR